MSAPSDWEAVELGELLRFSNGINAGKASYGRGTPFANILEVINNESITVGDIPGRVSLPSEVLDRYRVRRGDILFNRTSETQDEVGLTSVYLDDEPIVFGGFVFRGCPTTDRLDVDYSKYALRASSVRRQIISRGQGGIRANVGQRDLKSVSVALPGKPEQEAIAAVLDDVSEQVRAISRLITKQRAIAAALRYALLSGSYRLSGFSGEWATESISSFARVVGGGTPSTRVPSYWGGGIPWFTPAEIDSDGAGVVTESERTITGDGLLSSGANLLPAGSVLVTSRASIGNCAVAGVPVTTNQGFTSLVPHSSGSTWFLYYWVMQNKSALISRAAGSTFLEISASKVSSIPIVAPSLEEQAAIGAVLRDADLAVAGAERRLESAAALKQGISQQLLSGSIRLPVEETSS